MTTLRAALWAAVSSKPQAERDSLEQQLADARALCEQRGWPIVAELVVPGQSREYIEYTEAERAIEAYAALRQLCARRGLDILVCRGRDRLGRTDALIAQVEAIVSRAGAQVYSMTMPAEPGPAGQRDAWLSAIERAKAQTEVTELRRRHYAGKEASTKRGNFAYGHVPFGYRRLRDLTLADYAHTEPVDGKGAMDLIVYEPEAQAIRWLFARYLRADCGLRHVVKEANATGVMSPRPTGWYYGVAHYILTNPLYAGYVYHHRSETRAIGRHTPIITPALYDQAQALLARRAAMHPRTAGKGAYLFSGLLRCGNCGRMMTAVTEHTQDGYHYRIYKCLGRVAGYADNCRQQTIREAYIRAEVVGWVATFADNAGAFDAWRAGDNMDTGNSLERIARAIADADKSLTFWDRQAERGKVSEGEWEENRRRIQAERAALEMERATLADRDKRAAMLPDAATWRDVCQHPTDATLRAFLLRVVDYIEIAGKDITVHLL